MSDGEKENPIYSWLVIFGFLSLFVFGAYFLFFNYDDGDDLRYNDFEFVQGPDGFYYVELNTALGDQVIPFYFHPSQLEELDFDSNATAALFFAQRRGSEVNIAIDTDFLDDSYIIVAGVEVSKITGRVFGMRTTSGFTEPVQNITRSFSCENTGGPLNFVVEFKRSNTSFVESSGDYCVIINAVDGMDAVRLADLFVFKAMGVMI